MATTEELAELQARVDNRELMITAALPGSGDWGSQRDALAAEQAAIAEETSLQALLAREKLKPRAGRCCCIRSNCAGTGGMMSLLNCASGCQREVLPPAW